MAGLASLPVGDVRRCRRDRHALFRVGLSNVGMEPPYALVHGMRRSFVPYHDRVAHGPRDVQLDDAGAAFGVRAAGGGATNVGSMGRAGATNPIRASRGAGTGAANGAVSVAPRWGTVSGPCPYR